MLLDGVQRHVQLVGDLSIGFAGREETEHFEFAVGEWNNEWLAHRTIAGLPVGCLVEGSNEAGHVLDVETVRGRRSAATRSASPIRAAIGSPSSTKTRT